MHTYRSDIDGLRAVAILPVLLFHAGISFFSGGYVGVDVFFVISGYLITHIIYSEVVDGHFSILKFYERRARRILPALIVMCVVSAILAWWLFIPSDFKSFGKSIMSTMLFYSNIQFLDETGYFAQPSEFKPLLHTWSLAVEEQFYIVFPLLVAGVWAVSRRALKLSIFIFFLVSLIGSIILTDMRQVYAFFLSPTRAWELALGALIAMGFFPKVRQQFLLEGLSAFGLVLIVYAIVTFDAATHFPGYLALVPVIGASLIIYCGTIGPTLVARILSFKPFIWVGLISYSLYLWHWPLFVFAKYKTGGHLSPEIVTGLLVLSFLMAALSWKFVEQPFRSKVGLFSNNRIFVPTIVTSCLVVFLFGFGGKATEGYPNRWSEDFLNIVQKTNQNIDTGYACRSYDEKDVKKERSPCLYGESGEKPDFFVWGDSHAISLFPAFDTLANSQQKTGGMASYGGCPPLLTVTRLDKSREHLCLEFNTLIKNYLLKTKPHTVFMVGRWPLYSDGHNPSGPQANKITFIGSESYSEYSRDNSRKAFAEGLKKTITFLQINGMKPVIISQVPEHNTRIQNALTRALATGKNLNDIGTALSSHQKRQQNISDIFANITSGKIEILKPANVFCKNNQCAMTSQNGPLYTDYHHVSQAGAMQLIPLLEPLIEQVSR